MQSESTGFPFELICELIPNICTESLSDILLTTALDKKTLSCLISQIVCNVKFIFIRSMMLVHEIR